MNLISDIQDYFEYLIKKHDAIGDNSPVQISVNKIKNRIVFKIKTGYKLELLSPETMKLLGSAKKDVDKEKDGEDVPKLESVEIVLLHCNLVNSSYQQASKVLFTFVITKKFGQLITISPHKLTALKTTKAEFQSIQLWFTDQNNIPLEIEDSVNITLIIDQTLQTQPKYRKYVKRYGFFLFARKFGDKYGKKLMDTAARTRIDAAKTSSKWVVKKAAEATGYLIGNKIADKITSGGRPKEKTKKAEEIFIRSEKRHQIINVLKLF